MNRDLARAPVPEPRMTVSCQATQGNQEEKAMTALRKVLVVDDDPVIGKSFDRVLSGKGYAVITAANGEEALTKLGAEAYDRRPGTPVVIITGYGTAEHEARARAAGATRFIHKPLSPAMIEGSAREATEVAVAPAETATAMPAPVTKESALKNVALFFAAPFIGLAYLIALPFVGGAMLGWVALKAALKYNAIRNVGMILKHVALLAVAPFIGLASIVVLPFVGLVALGWVGVRALAENGKAGEPKT